MIVFKRTFYLLSYLIILIVPGTGQSAANYYFGSEESLWSHRSIIVARVVESKSELNGGKLVLEIQAVGMTDVLVPTTLTVDYRQGDDSMLDRVDFTKNAIFLLIIDKVNDGWCIDTNGFDFMPDHSAVLAVKNVGDPAVVPILEKVRELKHPHK